MGGQAHGIRSNPHLLNPPLPFLGPIYFSVLLDTSWQRAFPLWDPCWGHYGLFNLTVHSLMVGQCTSGGPERM